MAALLKHSSSTGSAACARPHHAYLSRSTRAEARARVAATAAGVYVGNLAFVTSDAALHALFGRCGPVERVVMGLNAHTRLPCGFAFVLFRARAAALAAVRFLHGTALDERLIKVELDKGFYEGRQFGRGPSGGQVRDDLRTTYDEVRARARAQRAHAHACRRKRAPAPLSSLSIFLSLSLLRASPSLLPALACARRVALRCWVRNAATDREAHPRICAVGDHRLQCVRINDDLLVIRCAWIAR